MDFQFQLDSLKATRSNAKKTLSVFSHAELNQIPEGFNNNLMWNYGHMIITQQLLCYKLSGTQMYVNTDLIKKYAKGTQPDEQYDEGEFQMLQDLGDKLIQHLEDDYNNGVFKNYNHYETSYGVVLKNIEDAISFNNMHEAHHLGNLFSMRKLI